MVSAICRAAIGALRSSVTSSSISANYQIKFQPFWNDIVPDQYSSLAKTIGWSLVKDMGHAQWVTAGLPVVPNILERFQSVSACPNEWLFLLGKMNRLTEYLQQLEERPGLKKMMENIIIEAIQLMGGASIMCTQIDSSKFNRCFSTPINKGN